MGMSDAATQEYKELGFKSRDWLAEIDTITKDHPDGLTPDQDQRVRFLIDQAKDAKVKMTAFEAKQARESDLENLGDFFSRPAGPGLAHGINGDSDEKKAFVKAGWEVKGGSLWAPTTYRGPLGNEPPRMVEMYPEATLFGPIPEGNTPAAQREAAYYKQVRAIFSPEYKSAWTRFMMLEASAPAAGMAYGMLTGPEQKALSEGTDTAGGFTVPPDFTAELLVRRAQEAVMRQLATVRTTSRDIWKEPALKAHATSGSIYSSNFVGSWVGEVPTATDTDPGFEQLEISIKKIRVMTKLSNDLIADSAVNLLAMLAQDGGRNMALVEDNGFIAGTGAAFQPVGILNAGLTTVDVEGSTANTISNASGAGSSSKLITLFYTVPAAYASRGSWLMSRAIEGKVRGLNDSTGRPLWPVYVGSGFAPAPRELIGQPLYNSDFVPTDGTDANQVVVFGDFSCYIIAQRTQITSLVSRERYIDTDQTGIFLYERVGGGIWDLNGLRVGVV